MAAGHWHSRRAGLLMQGCSKGCFKPKSTVAHSSEVSTAHWVAIEIQVWDGCPFRKKGKRERKKGREDREDRTMGEGGSVSLIHGYPFFFPDGLFFLSAGNTPKNAVLLALIAVAACDGLNMPGAVNSL